MERDTKEWHLDKDGYSRRLPIAENHIVVKVPSGRTPPPRILPRTGQFRPGVPQTI